MATKSTREPASACNLWHVVSGSSPISVAAQVGEELVLHEKLLLEGLSRYKPPCAASLTKLKAEDLKDYQRSFILLISSELVLDEWQSYELFQSYIENAFRASPKQLKTLLTQSKHFSGLLAMILNYYLEERSYLLKCQAYILAHWADKQHPLQKPFAEIIEKMIGSVPFPKQVLKEYKAACEWKAPSSSDSSVVLASTDINSWICANLQEQASLLELLLLYYKEFEITQEAFMEMFNLAQSEGFGQRQQNQVQVLSPDGHWQLKWIGQVWASLLLEGLDPTGLLFSHGYSSQLIEKHHLFQSSAVIRDITVVMTNWGDIPHHLPLMFAWAVLLFVHASILEGPSKGTELKDAQLLGSDAIRRGVMPYLDGLVSSTCLESRPSVAAVIQSAVHALLSLVLVEFSESSLGDMKVLVALMEKTVSSDLAEEFWNKGSEARCLGLLQGCQRRFPHDFRPMVDLLAALCHGEGPAERVFEYLREMPSYSEPLSELKFSECRVEDSSCYSEVPHYLCKSVDVTLVNHLILPAGCDGVFDPSRENNQFVTWDFPYSAWHLFLVLMDQYTHSTPSVVATADAKSQSRDLNLASLVSLVTQLLKHKWQLSEDLQPVIDRVYLILQRSVVSASPSLELISSCVQCITVLAQHDAHQVWLNLQQTGFLPHSTTMPSINSTAMPSVDGRHMASGHLGQLLSDVERAQGHYPVTLASLHLLQHLMKGLCSPIRGQSWPVPLDWAACLAFVVHEVFIDFSKWRYRNPGVCNKIGFCALSIFEVVLQQSKAANVSPPEQHQDAVEKKEGSSSTSRAFSLSQFLVQSLLYGEASVALLNLLSTDIEAVDVDSGGDGQRNQLLKLTKSALSVLTLLLQAKGEEVSPLERALAVKIVAQQPSTASTALFGEHIHLVAVITALIHHRHDRQLPRLATRLLQQLCVSGAVSIHTCLGSQAVPIRERFVRRLCAKTESVSTKVAILEMLTVAVQVQPGLIELFLDLTPVDGASGSKEFRLSRGSCLHPILTHLDKKQYSPSAELRSASLSFLYGLWKDRRVSALQAISKSADFMSNLLSPMFQDLPSWKEKEEPFFHHVNVALHIVRILTVELYYCESVSPDLKQQLCELAKKERYSYWLEQLVPVCNDVGMEEASDEDGSSLTPDVCKKVFEARFELLKSWQSFLTVAITCQATPSYLTGPVCPLIMGNVLDSLQAHVGQSHSPETVRSPLQLASLFLFLCKSCQKYISSPVALLDQLASLLVQIVGTDRALARLAWPSLSAALLILIRLVRRTLGTPPTAVCDLLNCYCLSLHSLRETVAGKDTQALLTSVFVLCELVPWMSGASHEWKSTFDQHAACTLLTHLMEHCLMTHDHPELAEAILTLYVSVSPLPKGADAVLSPSLMHQLCIGLAKVLDAQTVGNGAAAGQHGLWGSSSLVQANGQSTSVKASVSGSEKSASATSGSRSHPKNVWLSVWSLTIQLVTNLLGKLRHHFVQSALDFICAHETRVVESLCLISAEVVLMQHLEIVQHTVAFLNCLSSFHHQWQLVLRRNFHMVLNEVLQLCHRCCALLSHPKCLSRLAEPGPDNVKYDTSQARLMLRRFSGSPPSVPRSIGTMTATTTTSAASTTAADLSRTGGQALLSSTAASSTSAADDRDNDGRQGKRKRVTHDLSNLPKANGASATAGASSSSVSFSLSSTTKTSATNETPSTTVASSATPIASRGLRRSRLSFCEEEAPEPEPLPSSAVNLRSRLITILGDCFGVLQHLAPPLSDIFLNSALDKADCPLLLSFNCDALRAPADEEVVSFGDIVACIEACLSLVPRSSSSTTTSPRKARRLSKEPASPTKSAKADLPERSKVLYVVESALMVIMVQTCSFLKHSEFDIEQKRAMKRELNSIVGPLLQCIHRQLNCRPSLASSPDAKPSGSATYSIDCRSNQGFLALVETFVKTTLQ